MGEKEGKGQEKEKKPAESQKETKGDAGGEKKKEGGGGEKKDEGAPKVILRVDMHCEGCASKIKRCVKGFEGVESATTDMASNKLTVIGKVDPWKLRDRIAAKTRKKVEIVSPANPPKKDAEGGKKPAAAAAGDPKDQKKPDDKKPKEPAVSNVVLKIRLHCDGCIQRIKRTILKVKGVQEVTVDVPKDLVMVKGTMDASSLPPYLKGKLNRSVEIVPPAGGAGEKKEKPPAAAAAGGGDKGKAGADGGEKKGKDGDGGGGKKEGAPAAAVPAAAPPVVEANKMDFYGGPYGYRMEMAHAPQLFSDENPNACSVM